MSFKYRGNNRTVRETILEILRRIMVSEETIVIIVSQLPIITEDSILSIESDSGAESPFSIHNKCICHKLCTVYFSPFQY